MSHSRRRLIALAACLLTACSDRASRDRGARADSAAVIAAAAPRHELPAGTAIDATIQDSITSHHSSVGDRVRAVVSRNVTDEAGKVVIPAGAMVALRVAALHHGSAGAADAIVSVDVLSIASGSTTYTPSASAGRVGFALRPGKSAADDRELVVTAGTPVTIRLTNALGIAAQ